MSLSYRQLGEEIAKFSDEQLDCDVTVCSAVLELTKCDDVVTANDLGFGNDDMRDILDFECHPILLEVSGH